MALNDAEVKAVKETWALVAKDLQTSGISFFTRFFDQHPENKQFFPYAQGLNSGQLEKSEEMNRQALNVMSAVNSLMEMLSDTEAVLNELAIVAAVHKGLGIPAESFKTFKKPFLDTLETGLGAAYTEEAKSGYTKICDLVIDTVISNY